MQSLRRRVPAFVALAGAALAPAQVRLASSGANASSGQGSGGGSDNYNTTTTTTTTTATATATATTGDAILSSPESSRQVLYRSKRRTGTEPCDGARTGPAATPGKVRRGVAAGLAAGKEIRVRKKNPWGIQQLRDSWSEDAMTKRETENMSERIHREYRYHPDEKRRYYIKYTGVLAVPFIMTSWGLSYYYHTGNAPWRADPQHLLNVIRAADTSPRSRLYLYRLDEHEELPIEVVAYRAAHAGEREWSERVFAATHSAFARPTVDDLRRMELEDGDGAGEEEGEYDNSNDGDDVRDGDKALMTR